MHVRILSEKSDYSFWDNHYRLDGLIQRFESGPFAQHTPGTESEPYQSALSAIIAINLSGLAILLHQAAASKAIEDNLPSSIASQAMLLCAKASTELSQRIHAINESVHVLAIGHFSPFFKCSLSLTMKMHIWVLEQSFFPVDTAAQLQKLELLSNLVRKTLSLAHQNLQVMEKVDAVLNSMGGYLSSASEILS